MTKEKFEKYKRLKDELSFEYRGYPVGNVIALDLIVHVYVDREYTIKSFVKHILLRVEEHFSSLHLEDLKIFEPKKTLFSMGIYKRKDYYEIWNFVKAQTKAPVSFDYAKQKRVYRFNPRNIAKAFSAVLRTKGLSLVGKLNMSAKITYYLNVIDAVEAINPKAQKYCAFSGVHEHEAILTCYFQKRGIPTYSLQHGLFAVFKKQIPLDSILYENIISDFHLCWGQSTKDEFADYGIDENSLVVAGYPRNVTRPPVPVSLNKRECLVLFARYSFHETNLRLVEILKKHTQNESLNISVKLHPTLYWEQYKGAYEDIAEQNNWNLIPQEVTLTELFKDNKFGWAIAVNTGSYYEAYMYNLPCLRYNDGSFQDTVDIVDDVFSDARGLEFCFNSIPFEDPQRLKRYFKQVDEKLDYAIGLNINNYDVLNP